MAKSKKVKKKASDSGRGKYVAAGLLLVVLGCSAWIFLKPSRILVPSVVGKTLAEATELIKASNLGVATRIQESDSSELDGKVLTQEPSAGASVPRMSVVTLVIAKGPDGIPLPDLTGKTRSEAEDQLLRLGFVVKFTEATSQSVPIGRVITQSPPAGAKVLANGVVNLTISGGVGDIEVPELRDMTVQEAKDALERLGLDLVVKEVAQDGFREGDPAYIIRQEPEAGQTLGAGARVTVFIPIAVPVTTPDAPNPTGIHAPQFEGLTIAAARKLAATEGVALSLPDGAPETAVITFQDPPSGDPLSSQASVQLKTAAAAVIPSLSGLSEAEARVQLEKSGLVPGTIRRSYGEILGEVIGQRPSPGIEAVAGSRVDLVISDPKAAPPSAQGPAPTPAFTPAPWVGN